MACKSLVPENIKDLLSSFVCNSVNSSENRRRSSIEIIDSTACHSPSSCQPKNKSAFFKRVQTYSQLQWFAKPVWLAPVQCARFGWINTGVDILQCVTCKAMLSGRMPQCFDPNVYEECCTRLRESLCRSHSSLCPWPNNPSPESFLTLNLDSREDEVQQFYSRVKALLQLRSRLPQLHVALRTLVPKLEESEIDSLFELYKNQSSDNTEEKSWLQAACVLALLGWGTKSSSSCPVLHCKSCLRDVGMWNYVCFDTTAEEILAVSSKEAIIDNMAKEPETDPKPGTENFEAVNDIEMETDAPGLKSNDNSVTCLNDTQTPSSEHETRTFPGDDETTKQALDSVDVQTVEADTEQLGQSQKLTHSPRNHQGNIDKSNSVSPVHSLNAEDQVTSYHILESQELMISDEEKSSVAEEEEIRVSDSDEEKEEQQGSEKLEEQVQEILEGEQDEESSGAISIATEDLDYKIELAEVGEEMSPEETTDSQQNQFNEPSDNELVLTVEDEDEEEEQFEEDPEIEEVEQDEEKNVDVEDFHSEIEEGDEHEEIDEEVEDAHSEVEDDHSEIDEGEHYEEIDEEVEDAHSEIDEEVEDAHSEIDEEVEDSHSEIDEGEHYEEIDEEVAHSEIDEEVEDAHSEIDEEVEDSHSEIDEGEHYEEIDDDEEANMAEEGEESGSEIDEEEHEGIDEEQWYSEEEEGSMDKSSDVAEEYEDQGSPEVIAIDSDSDDDVGQEEADGMPDEQEGEEDSYHSFPAEDQGAADSDEGSEEVVPKNFNVDGASLLVESSDEEDEDVDPVELSNSSEASDVIQSDAAPSPTQPIRLSPDALEPLSQQEMMVHIENSLEPEVSDTQEVPDVPVEPQDGTDSDENKTPLQLQDVEELDASLWEACAETSNESADEVIERPPLFLTDPDEIPVDSNLQNPPENQDVEAMDLSQTVNKDSNEPIDLSIKVDSEQPCASEVVCKSGVTGDPVPESDIAKVERTDSSSLVQNDEVSEVQQTLETEPVDSDFPSDNQNKHIPESGIEPEEISSTDSPVNVENNSPASHPEQESEQTVTEPQTNLEISSKDESENDSPKTTSSGELDDTQCAMDVDSDAGQTTEDAPASPDAENKEVADMESIPSNELAAESDQQTAKQPDDVLDIQQITNKEGEQETDVDVENLHAPEEQQIVRDAEETTAKDDSSQDSDGSKAAGGKRGAAEDPQEETEPPKKKSRPEPKKTFVDPAAEHRQWCPWVTHLQGNQLVTASSVTPSDDPLQNVGWKRLLYILLPSLLPEQTSVTALVKNKMTPPHIKMRNIRGLFKDWTSPQSS